MVSAPKPPGSSASISPPAAVLEIAPAKVLHGAVRLHGLTSSPTPETQVRVACAFALTTPMHSAAAANTGVKIRNFMKCPSRRMAFDHPGCCRLLSPADAPLVRSVAYAR